MGQNNTYNPAQLNQRINELEAAGTGSNLPVVSSEDNGKALQVVEGSWATGDVIPEVIANPEGEITNSLTRLQIGDEKYNTDLAYSAITITPDATNVDTSGTSFAAYCEKKGKIVNLMIQKIIPKVNLSTNEVLITGLPIPAQPITFTVFDVSATKLLHFRLDDTGTLRNWYTAFNIGQAVDGLLTYFEVDNE